MNNEEIIKLKCKKVCGKFNLGAAAFPLLWSISNKHYNGIVLSLILGIPIFVGFFIAVIYALFAIFLPSRSGFIFIPLLPFLALITPLLLAKSIPVYLNIIFYLMVALNIFYSVHLGFNANRDILETNFRLVNKFIIKQNKWYFWGMVKLIFFVVVAVLSCIHYPEIF